MQKCGDAMAMEQPVDEILIYDLAGSKEIPHIHFDAQEGMLEISGNSMPENPMRVYEGALAWVRRYILSPAQRTVVSFRFKYYNTSTSKIILMMLELLSEVLRHGHEIEVVWYYAPGDEDMEEAGYEFAENSILPFRVEEQD